METLMQSGSAFYEGQMFIDGVWTNPENRATIAVENPANEQALGTVPEGLPEDGRAAVEAAHRAHPSWASKPAIERGQLVLEIANAVQARIHLLAPIITREHWVAKMESMVLMATCASRPAI